MNPVDVVCGDLILQGGRDQDLGVLLEPGVGFGRIVGARPVTVLARNRWVDHAGDVAGAGEDEFDRSAEQAGAAEHRDRRRDVVLAGGKLVDRELHLAHVEGQAVEETVEPDVVDRPQLGLLPPQAAVLLEAFARASRSRPELRLKIWGAGPERPALEALGAAVLTVTDADLLLGYLDAEYFLGGEMQLDKDAARRAIEELTETSGCSTSFKSMLRATGTEIRQCRDFLAAELDSFRSGGVVMALGSIAHRSVVAAVGLRLAEAPFGHAARHTLPRDITLIDSYHCSRYNTQTRRLTPEMFHTVFAKARALIDSR